MRMFRLLLSGALLATSVAALPTAAVQAQTAAVRPAPVSELVAKVNIPYEQFVLDNGLRTIVHTDRKAPVIAVSIWYDVGSKHEPKGKTGFAHLFEHLMFNGSENAPGDFFEPLRQIGATDLNGTTWFDRTNYFQTVPTGAIETALFLESDRMGHLLGAVTQEKLTNQIGVVQNEKRQGDNQPYGLVEYAQIAALLPPDHPYGHSTIGSMADLSAATLDDVKTWFKQHYGPNNAVLVLAGDIDAATARPLVQKWFGWIPRGPQQQPVAAPIPTLAAPKSEVMKDRVATVRLYRNWTAPGLNHPDAVPLSVGMSVLGGLSSSRLDNALVREEKIAVAVTAQHQDFAQLGFVEITADVKPGVDPAVVAKRLDAVIADLVANGPTEDEVRRVATTRVAARIAGIESVGGFSGKAVTLAEGALYSNDPEHYRKELAAYAAATPASVKAALQKWLRRPVYALTVEPGERPAYEEAAGVGGFVQPTGFAPEYYHAPGEEPRAAASPDPDRSQLPPLAETGTLDFPDIERATLSNGIPVYLARRTAVPQVRVAISFDAGHAADPKDALGTQSLMLNAMREGTATRSSVAIAEEQERLGAQINTAASLDRTTVTLSALTPNLAPSLDLFADIVRNPAFAQSEVERVRSQQLARISQEMTNPNALGARALAPLLFGDAHPYGIPLTGTGDPAAVAKLTPENLRAFHDRWFRPDTAAIYVVGDATMDGVKALLEKSFGTWPQNRSARPVKNFDVAIPAPRQRIVLIDRPDSPQSVILMGKVLEGKGSDRLETLNAANEVLGGNFLSRINMNLRETKGWSYGVRSQVVQPENNLAFLVTAPVQADRTGDSIRELFADMRAFLDDRGISDPEFSRTIAGNVLQLPGSFETSQAVLGGMQNIVNLKRPDNYYEKLADTYRGMSKEAIDAAMRAKLDPGKLLLVVVGDAKKIRAQLDATGLPVETLAMPGAK